MPRRLERRQLGGLEQSSRRHDLAGHDDQCRRLEVRTLEFGWFAAYNPYRMGADNVELYYTTGAVSNENMSFSDVKNLFR